MSRYLLDTHIFIWLMLADKRLKARQKIEAAAHAGKLCISAISCWEIGMLASRERVHFGLPRQQWIEQALTAPGLNFLELSPQIAIEASYLPGRFHGDPADRILIATARVHNLVLITQDQKIITYGKHGYVNVMVG